MEEHAKGCKAFLM